MVIDAVGKRLCKARMARPLKIFAVASGGGHWEQLMLLREAFAGHEVVYGITNKSLAERDGLGQAEILPDSNRNEKMAALRCLRACFQAVRKHRPDIVLTTGALPGLFCIVIGRVMGARTIWIDSVANHDRPSMSGRVARWWATSWITQWEHLSRPGDPHYYGSLL